MEGFSKDPSLFALLAPVSGLSAIFVSELKPVSIITPLSVMLNFKLSLDGPMLFFAILFN